MSIIGRISTLSQHSRTVNDFSQVQSRLANVQNSISSGYKTDTFQGLAGKVEQFTAIESQLSKIRNYQDNLVEAQSRFSGQRDAVTEMIRIADEMEDLMTLRISGAGERIAFDIQMRDLRDSLALEMNTTFGGQYLFGGTRTNKPPVIVEPRIPDPLEEGVPDDMYYQGSKENIITRPQDIVELEFDVRADNPAFQKIFAAISQSIKADERKDMPSIQNAFGVMREGISELVAVEASLNARVVNIDNIIERHEANEFYLKGLQETIIQTDIVEASTQVVRDQTLLQASFQTFSRISSLSLINYLN